MNVIMVAAVFKMCLLSTFVNPMDVYVDCAASDVSRDC